MLLLGSLNMVRLLVVLVYGSTQILNAAALTEATNAVSLPPSTEAKCLLVSIDNRDLNPNLHSNHYPSMTAVLNMEYAKRHNYDFLYVMNILEDLEKETRAKFPNSDIIPPTDNAKDAATAFHVGLKQFRAASWAKLPALWHITTTVGMKYDYIWYIDSDAAVSPLNMQFSIEENLKRWEKEGKYIRGNGLITQSTFIFFHNHPWRDNMPCAGSFIYRPKLAEPVLREWWDFDMPVKNFKHFHEQDALWHMIEAENDDAWKKKYPDQALFKMNSSIYTVLREQQFPSNWKRYEELWLCHIASYNYVLRMPILYQFLKVLGLDVPHRYAAKIEELVSKHVVKIKLLDASEKMEQISSKDKARIAHFPPHDTNSELEWYDAHVTSKNEATIPLAQLHEGRLIRRKGEFWVVVNGTKRGFNSFDTFLKLGFYNDLGHSLYNNEVEQIATGTTITEVDVKQGISSLSRYYSPISIAGSGGDTSADAAAKLSSRNFTEIDVAVIRERMQRRKQLRHGKGKQARGAAGATGSGSTPSSVSAGSGTGIGLGSALGHHCIVNETLEQLVHANGTRSILYLVAHDTASEHLARKFANCKESWIQPVIISSTVFFESIIYQDVFPPYQKEWEDMDFVITATYKTVAKTLHYNGYTQNLQLIQDSLRIARDGNYDIVPFLRSGSGTMSFCLYFHGKPFRAAWDALLVELGYSIPLIRSLDEMKSFYRNIFIIKPKVLKELMLFMNRAMYIAYNNPTVHKLLSVDSRYKEGQESVAQRIFGTSYYQLHPFIFERLPSFYLHASNAKICAATDGPCPYNS